MESAKLLESKFLGKETLDIKTFISIYTTVIREQLIHDMISEPLQPCGLEFEVA